MSVKTTTLLAAAGIGLLAACAAAPANAEDRYQITTLADGLAYPWSIAFLPDDTLLVSERNGDLRIIRDGRLDPEPVAGVPEAFVSGQGGLHDVVLHPRFAENRLIYLTYAHGDSSANATRVARGRFDGERLTDVEVLFTAEPAKTTPAHYGGRMVFLEDETFLLTIGDGYNYREEAQRLSSHFGTIVRLNDDGSIPDDNPFVDEDDALASIWSYGHRNQQGIVLDRATGRVYEHEHGPQGGDELNLIEPGTNYGWPVATYGIDYTGAKISPYTEYEGTEQPLKYWVPSIAPAGMTLYTGRLFPDWRGDLFIAALVPGDVRRIDMEDGLPVDEEILFSEENARMRDVRTGPDGALYLLTDEPDGRVLKVTPR